MFNKEELEFIKTLLEEELINIEMDKLHLEDYNEIKGYEEIISPRKKFIENLLIKMKDIK